MSRVLDVAGADALRRLYTPQLQPAGARIGVFSGANHWRGTTVGLGYNCYVANRAMGVAFWSSGDGNNQDVWCFNSTVSGWHLVCRTPHTLSLSLRTGSTVFTNLGDVYLGLNVAWLWFDAAGDGWYCINGGYVSPIDPALKVAYVPGDAAAQQGFGYSPAEASFAALNRSILWSAVIDSPTLNATTIRAMANARNLLDRWNVPPVVTQHAGLVDLKRWTLWDGASATFTDVGQQLTRVGTGGGKTTMPAYLRYKVPQHARWDSVLTAEMGVLGTNGVLSHSPFNTTRFQSSAADPSATGPAGVVLELGTSYYGSSNESVIQAGLSVDGVNQLGNQAGANPFQGQGLNNGDRSLSVCDMPGIAAGAAKTFIATDGMRADASLSNILSAGTVEYVRVPATQPITWLTRTVPTKRLIFSCDSVGQYIAGNNAANGVKGPVYQAYTMLARGNAVAAGWRSLVSGWLSGSLWQRISSAARRAEYLDQIRRGAGSTDTTIWQGLGSGDYQFSTYATVAGLVADYLLHLADVLGAGLPNLKYYVVGPTTMGSETNPNSGGWNLPQLRTGLQNMVTALADPRVFYVDAGAPFVPYTVSPTAGANFGVDGKHLTVTGAVTYEASMRAVLGY